MLGVFSKEAWKACPMNVENAVGMPVLRMSTDRQTVLTKLQEDREMHANRISQPNSKRAVYRTNHNEGFYQSSHYYRTSQPIDEVNEDTTNRPSKEKIIDVFEFEPVGFMSHGRW